MTWSLSSRDTLGAGVQPLKKLLGKTNCHDNTYINFYLLHEKQWLTLPNHTPTHDNGLNEARAIPNIWTTQCVYMHLSVTHTHTHTHTKRQGTKQFNLPFSQNTAFNLARASERFRTKCVNITICAWSSGVSGDWLCMLLSELLLGVLYSGVPTPMLAERQSWLFLRCELALQCTSTSNSSCPNKKWEHN